MLPASIFASPAAIENNVHFFSQSARRPSLPSLRPSRGASSGKCHRRTVLCRTAVLSEQLTGFGGGGSGGRGNGVGRKFVAEDGGGGSFFEYNALVDVLIKGGVALSELPRDLQEALSLGLMSMKDVHCWVSISTMPFIGGICRAAPAVRDRVMGNPRFLMQLCVELMLGLSAKTVAEMRARGDKCFKEELPFFLSDLALEAIADCALVWLLSPKCTFKMPPSNRIARGIARLPGHSLQCGQYSVSQRLATVLYRSGQFFAVGLLTSALGHSITKWAVEQKKETNGDVHLAPVLDNSIGFGAFMALSSNLRYQTVNCLEERALDVFLPSRTLNTLATFILRFSNCYFGGVQWMWFAKTVGLQ